MSFIESQKQIDKVSYLPYELINIVYSYLTPKDRLALLKQKYPWDKIKNKLMSIPKEKVNLYKLLTCINLVRPILCNFLDENGDIMRRCRYVLFIKPKDIRNVLKAVKYKPRSQFNSTQMIDAVICAIRYYTRMYKETTSSIIHYKYEKVMIQLYAHVLSL